MSLQIGIVGLPNVGKSTLFNALTKKKADAANYPFCTIDPNVGVVKVPDARLETLAQISHSEEIIPTIIEFVDIAGLVKNAHKGEGLGNQFLSHIREVDAICEVLRAFPDENVLHVDGSVDPARDRETIHLELAMADLATVTKRIENIQGHARTGEKDAKALLSLYERMRAALDKGEWTNTLTLTEEEKRKIKDLNLLTRKQLLFVLNISEGQEKHTPAHLFHLRQGFSGQTKGGAYEVPLHEGVANRRVSGGHPGTAEGRGGFIAMDIKKEAELSELSEGDLRELHLNRTALDTLIHVAYETLSLITFFTSGPKETRAWTVPRGTHAPDAAGVIHSDFARGFIAAEVIHAKDFIALGGEAKVKDAGKMRLEGKKYIIQDGDVVHFRFSV